jgi:hypothetical protein
MLQWVSFVSQICSHAHAPSGCGKMNKGNERLDLNDAVEGR